MQTYRNNIHEEDTLKEIIQGYIKDGIIRESHSPWRAPIVLVKKKNGKTRLCVDYRRLNEVTKKDKYPMPIVDEILNSFGKAKIFSKLDALSGYHQIDMAEEDIEKTAFSCRLGSFEFLKMPFGLVNGPATFQRVMDNLLRDEINVCVQVYLDDIIIYSENRAQHEEDLRRVLEKIKNAGLKLNKDKCEFFKESIEVLGHVISASRIKPHPDRVRAIKECEVPRNKKEPQSFLGLVNYCRKFIKNVSIIRIPLYELLKKDISAGNLSRELGTAAF